MPAEQTLDGLAGNRYIAYARTAAGTAARLDEQIRLVRHFGNLLGMVCADEVRIAGVSGWLTALRPDLRDLLARKRTQNDFQVVIMEDHARLTRTGPDGCDEVEAEFARHGVQILYLTDVLLPTWR